MQKGRARMSGPTEIAVSETRFYGVVPSEVLMAVNLLLSPVPRLFTATMMASEMPAAIRPYSMAVAPDSSRKNFKRIDFIGSSFPKLPGPKDHPPLHARNLVSGT